MSKKDYKNALVELPPGVIETLKHIVEWVDNALAKSQPRNFEFREAVMRTESGLRHAVLIELVTDDMKGIEETEGLLKTEWDIFDYTGKGTLRLHHKSFALFKSALEQVVKKQPFGYDNIIVPAPKKTRDIKIIKQGDKLYLVMGKDELYITSTGTNQGKLLSLLTNPVGVARTIASVARDLRAEKTTPYLRPQSDVAIIKNAVKEIQRKLASYGKRNVLHFHFDGNHKVWLKIS